MIQAYKTIFFKRSSEQSNLKSNFNSYINGSVSVVPISPHPLSFSTSFTNTKSSEFIILYRLQEYIYYCALITYIQLLASYSWGVEPYWRWSGLGILLFYGSHLLMYSYYPFSADSMLQPTINWVNEVSLEMARFGKDPGNTVGLGQNCLSDSKWLRAEGTCPLHLQVPQSTLRGANGYTWLTVIVQGSKKKTWP